ncbi:MAG: LolA family protein [Solirubrobacteraceae bacterium]
MRFLRTAPTGRLLAVIGSVIAATAAAAAIALAATGSGPAPTAQPLASSLHQALTAKAVTGVSADINFTNNLISSSSFTGGPRDPILQGASGRIWIANDGRLRLELQSDNGDTQVVLNKDSLWISDPASQTVYKATLPARTHDRRTTPDAGGVPTVKQIQADLNALMGHLNLSGTRTSDPTDVGGRPAYSVQLSPRHGGGLIGAAQVAWDAVTGTPLRVAIYARGDSTPVLALQASNVSYGKLPASDFAISPPSGYRVVKIAAPSGRNPAAPAGAAHRPITGARDVQSHLAFRLAAPQTLAGLARHQVKLLDWGGVPSALVTYGHGLGAVAVLEQSAGGQHAAKTHVGSLSLPTVSVHGSTGTELATALGTVLRYDRGGVSYTILGSVPKATAEQAARALAP